MRPLRMYYCFVPCVPCNGGKDAKHTAMFSALRRNDKVLGLRSVLLLLCAP